MLGWNASQEIGARSFFADIPKEKSAAENWQRSNTVTRYTHLTRAIQTPERNKTALYFVAFVATNKARAPQQNIRFVGVRGTTGCGAGLPKPGATPSLCDIVSQRAKSVKPSGAVFYNAAPKAHQPWHKPP